MRAAAQSDGLSPKRLNVPSVSQQFEACSGSAQNCGPSKGQKRDRGEQGIDPAKRDRDFPLKVDDSETENCMGVKIESGFTNITEKGGLPHVEAVEKLVHFMQHDQTERKMDFAGRVRLADIIAATESRDCLNRFMQLRGLPALNDWLQETNKGKGGEGDSPKETDKPIEELILALLRALENLPISLTALQSCSIGKSVNHLHSHTNLDIQKKAKYLVENWKKRVGAELKSTDAKPVVSGQAVSWSAKGVFPEVSSPINRRSRSSEPSLKNPVSRISSPKISSAKPGTDDSVVTLNPVISGSSKLRHVQLANVAANLKDPTCKSTGGTCGPELPAVKEEKISSSSQSLNNSHSCSSDHAKTAGSSKENARRSTAASVNSSKTSRSSVRGHRRANNGLGSGIQNEAGLGRFSSLDHSVLPETSSQSDLACERGSDTLSDHGNSQRLIIRLPNQGPSPGRSTSGGSCEELLVSGSRASSPVLAGKHEQNNCRVKMKTENSQPHSGSNANVESQQRNDIKAAAGSAEGDKSPCGMLDDDHSRTAEEASKDECATQVAYPSYMNEKGVFSSKTRAKNSFSPLNALIEIKYSETSQSMQPEDDTAMNLLASVAGEVSKLELIMPTASPRNSSANKLGCEGENIGKLNADTDAGPSRHPGPSEDVEKVISMKEDKDDGRPLIAKEEQNQMESGTNISSHDKGTPSTRPSPLPVIDSKAAESSAKTENTEVELARKCSQKPLVYATGDGDDKSNAVQRSDIKNDRKFSMNSSANEDRNAWIVCEKVKDGCTTRSDVETALGDQCSLAVPDRKLLLAGESSSCATDKQGQGLLNSTNQKHLPCLHDHSEAFDRSADSTAAKLDLRPSCSSSAVGINKSDYVVVINKVLKEDEKKEHVSSTLADVSKLALSTVLAHGAANGIGEIKESKDNFGELSNLIKPRGIISRDTDYIARHSSHKLSDDVSAKEDFVSSDDDSFTAKAMSNRTTKLDFDLNEGIPGYEGHHAETVSLLVVCSSAIHLSGLPPLISPILSGLPSSITVAAPAKGSFLPPENLLRVKPEAGWKDSAATSAFRPAESGKILGMILTSPDIAVSAVSRKQSRPAFDIDLNIADDQVLEEDISHSSIQTTGSESGTNKSRDGPLQRKDIELDLNRAGEVAENNQLMSNSSRGVEVTLLPARPLPGIYLNTTNCSRNFDLNNGPSFDEARSEPSQRSLLSRSNNSIHFLPQLAGLRMNNAEISTMSPWFSAARPCAPVTVQSFLPAREQPYPIETTSGTQRIMASAADGGQFRSDSSRAPVISTSPAMMFHHPAYQYAGFPFNPSVHLQTTGFPMISTSHASSAPAGLPYFPTIAPSLVGPVGALPALHARQYTTMNLPEGNSIDDHDSNLKWRRQGLDLNSGPASIDVEGKDERVPLSMRPNLITPPHAFVQDQIRMYQMPGLGIKRKEPEGGWDAERSSYKQLSWQ